MAAYELVDFLLGDGMTILKLVQSGELEYVKSVRRDNICHIAQTNTPLTLGLHVLYQPHD